MNHFEELLKIEDCKLFAQSVEMMGKEDLLALQDMLNNKINHMVFSPAAVTQLSIVELQLERIKDGETK